MPIQRTFSIIKPDATKRNLTGAINAKFEAAGLSIVAQKKIHLTKKNLQPLIIMTDQQKRLFTKVKSTTLNRTLGAKKSLLIKKYIDL